MTWFKVDDGLHSHPKWLAAPPAAKALWATAGSWCAAHLTDGHVPRHALPLLGARPRDAAELVRVGLWETNGDGWLFHDWEAFQPSKEKVLADRDVQRRRAALNADPKIREALKSRDCNRCRYCGVEVNWRDRKGPTGATYDHVVPLTAGGEDTVENLVVCCRRCNERKGTKTLEQAGMVLLPIPDQIKQTSRSDLDQPPRSDQPPDPTRPLPPSPPAAQIQKPVDTAAATAAEKTTNGDPTEYQPTVQLPPVAEGLEPGHLWPEMARRQHFLRRQQGERLPPLTSTRGRRWADTTAAGYADHHHLQAQAVIATTQPGTPADAVIWELEPDLALRNWAQPDTPPPAAEPPPDPEAARAGAAAARAALTRNGSQPTREDNGGHIPDEAR